MRFFLVSFSVTHRTIIFALVGLSATHLMAAAMVQCPYSNPHNLSQHCMNGGTCNTNNGICICNGPFEGVVCAFPSTMLVDGKTPNPQCNTRGGSHPTTQCKKSKYKIKAPFYGGKGCCEALVEERQTSLCLIPGDLKNAFPGPVPQSIALDHPNVCGPNGRCNTELKLSICECQDQDKYEMEYCLAPSTDSELPGVWIGYVVLGIFLLALLCACRVKSVRNKVCDCLRYWHCTHCGCFPNKTNDYFGPEPTLDGGSQQSLI
jgi:hypothetical protein